MCHRKFKLTNRLLQGGDWRLVEGASSRGKARSSPGIFLDSRRQPVRIRPTFALPVSAAKRGAPLEYFTVRYRMSIKTLLLTRPQQERGQLRRRLMCHLAYLQIEAGFLSIEPLVPLFRVAFLVQPTSTWLCLIREFLNTLEFQQSGNPGFLEIGL